MYPYPLLGEKPGKTPSAKSPLAQALRLEGEAEGYVLPLAALKWNPERVAYMGADTAKTFLSSGTTGALRSRSPFSKAGLSAYQNAATDHFDQVLQGLGQRPGAKLRIISLIPPSEGTEGETWPDSSLGFMVAGFGERWPLVYGTAKTLKPLYEEAQSQNPDGVILLGTALHWLAALTEQPFPLARNTWLLETGGTKGQFQELSRAAFYRQLCSGFHLTEAQIISEYGSCELAAQAYDYCPRGEHTPLAQRRFRFRDDVTVMVATAKTSALSALTSQNAGIGTLALFDPIRVDLPYVFLSEDRVELNSDGSFKLLGRVKSAPLKGCSLLAEQMPSASPRSPSPQLSAQPMPKDMPTIGERVTALRSFWQSLLASEEFRAALCADLDAISADRLSAFGRDQVLKGAISDLERSFLVTDGQYLPAIAQIVGRGCRAEDAASGREGESWLMVLPSSHPIAGLYPLTMAAIAGISLEIRGSSRQEFEILPLIISRLKDFSFVRMKCIRSDEDYQRSLDHAAGVMAFGHDSTLALFHQRLASRGGVKLRGFGTAFSATVVAGPPTEDAVAAVVKDLVSLGGQGCLASRFVACLSDEEPWLRALDHALAPYRPQDPRSVDRDILIRWLLLGFQPFAGVGPWQLLAQPRPSASSAKVGLAAEALTMATGDMIPVFSCEGVNSLAGLAGLKKLAVSPAALQEAEGLERLREAGVELCPLGQLNVNPITGWHLGERLF